MKVKIPVKVSLRLRHADSKGLSPKEFAEKTIETSVTVEAPQSFLDILNAFDSGFSVITFLVRGARDLRPGEDGDPNIL